MVFEVGKTYTGRSACDHNCIFSITITKRTEKSIFTTEGKRLGIKVIDGVELVWPKGKYSMAPIIKAR